MNIMKLVVEFVSVFAVALTVVLIVTFSGTSSGTEKVPLTGKPYSVLRSCSTFSSPGQSHAKSKII